MKRSRGGRGARQLSGHGSGWSVLRRVSPGLSAALVVVASFLYAARKERIPWPQWIARPPGGGRVEEEKGAGAEVAVDFPLSAVRGLPTGELLYANASVPDEEWEQRSLLIAVDAGEVRTWASRGEEGGQVVVIPGLCPGHHEVLAFAISARDGSVTSHATGSEFVPQSGGFLVPNSGEEGSKSVGGMLCPLNREIWKVVAGKMRSRVRTVLRLDVVVEGDSTRHFDFRLKLGKSIRTAAREFVEKSLDLPLPEQLVIQKGKVARGSEAEQQGLDAFRWTVSMLERELVAKQLRKSRKKEQIGQAKSVRLAIGETIDEDEESLLALEGWISLDVNILDATSEEDMNELLDGRLVDAFLAEHVWEHMTLLEGYFAARNCFNHLEPGGRLRIAVPRSSYWPSSGSQIAPWLSARMSLEDIRDGHLVQYTEELLINVCHSAGFDVNVVEGCSSDGNCVADLDATSEDIALWGRVRRSRMGGDSRGMYSIVVDCIKPRDPSALGYSARTADEAQNAKVRPTMALLSGSPSSKSVGRVALVGPEQDRVVAYIARTSPSLSGGQDLDPSRKFIFPVPPTDIPLQSSINREKGIFLEIGDSSVSSSKIMNGDGNERVSAAGAAALTAAEKARPTAERLEFQQDALGPTSVNRVNIQQMEQQEQLVQRPASEADEEMRPIEELRLSGRNALLRGDVDDAVRLCGIVLAELPDDPGALMCIGVAHAQLKRLDSSQEYLMRAMRHAKAVDTLLAATINASSIARMRALDSTRDPMSELLLLVHGLRILLSSRGTLTGDIGLGERELRLRIAASLEEAGQLTAAVRQYQRIILQEPQSLQALQGLGGLSTRLEENSHPVSGEACHWRIVSPSENQVFAQDEPIQLEYDTTLLDPLARISELGEAEEDLAPIENIAYLVCSHFGDSSQHMTNCLPRGQVASLSPGWHTITVSLYSLPTYTLVSGDADVESCAPQRIHFCVQSGDQDRGHDACELGERQNNPTHRKSASDYASPFVHGKGEYQADLPFCFVTMVLNGMPFITHHAKVFEDAAQLSAQADGRPHSAADYWEWHVVEGVASGRADSRKPYSDASLEPFADSVTGLSTDGTTEYLNHLMQSLGGGRLKIHRPPHGNKVWRDKIQMMNTASFSLSHECLMVQIDSDELWTAEQLFRLRETFVSKKPRAETEVLCAYFHAHFFVGPNLVTVSENGYGHSSYEWLRAWKYSPYSSVWLRHAPPGLARFNQELGWSILEGERCLTHEETRRSGMVFTHFAYALEQQARFKEVFYGYDGFLDEWRQTRDVSPPFSLSDYFSHLGQGTWQVEAVVDFANSDLALGLSGGIPSLPLMEEVVPATPPFLNQETYETMGGNAATVGTEITSTFSSSSCSALNLAVDCVCFQGMQGDITGGIQRVWQYLLAGIASRLAELNDSCLTLLLRGMSDLPPSTEAYLRDALPPQRLRIVRIAPYNKEFAHDSDGLGLGLVLSNLNATAFMSSLYTAPLFSSSSIRQHLLLHDFIPSYFNWDIANTPERTKMLAISSADSIILASHATAQNFPTEARLKPGVSPRVCHSGVDQSVFFPSDPADILAIRKKHGIPDGGKYIVAVGSRLGYKNLSLTLYNTLAEAGNAVAPHLVLVGSQPLTKDEIEDLEGVSYTWIPAVSDRDLATIYSGAGAHVLISLKEGYGLTVLEALACGCPVVVSQETPSVQEVLLPATRSIRKSLSPLFLVNPVSRTEIWRAIRAALASEIPEKVFSEVSSSFPSWQQLADAILEPILLSPSST